MNNERLMALASRRKAEKPENRKRYLESSRLRLLKTLERKIRTSFIGALATFETLFGHMWGHGKKDSQCTPQQRAMRETWEQCRTEVLNNGNTQLRAVKSELQQYDVDWQRVQSVLIPVPPDRKSES